MAPPFLGIVPGDIVKKDNPPPARAKISEEPSLVDLPTELTVYLIDVSDADDAMNVAATCWAYHTMVLDYFYADTIREAITDTEESMDDYEWCKFCGKWYDKIEEEEHEMDECILMATRFLRCELCGPGDVQPLTYHSSLSRSHQLPRYPDSASDPVRSNCIEAMGEHCHRTNAFAKTSTHE